MNNTAFIEAALLEDIKDGDHSTLACIPAHQKGSAVLKIKEDGVLSGLEIAQEIFHFLDPNAMFEINKKSGDSILYGETAFIVHSNVHTILKAERLALNCMQRMSGIATLTYQHVSKIQKYKSKILDTRKTTPLFRHFEKQAVVNGGGWNHRFGLYDMIMLKDNHIDYCGGITAAINKTNDYLNNNNLSLKIEVETRNLDEVAEVLAVGNVHRIMLDNFHPNDLSKAISLINSKFETEASGGINLSNIEEYAATNVDYISIGALTHHAVSLDLSLKAL